MEQETGEAAGAQLCYTTEQAAGLIAERKRMIDALQELMHGSTMRLMERRAAENSTPAPGLPPEQMNELAVRIAKVREETRRKREEAEREGRPWPA